MPVTLEVDGSCEVPTDVKIALYRIAQEALNNIAKHAGASQARVSLRCRWWWLRLLYRDRSRGLLLRQPQIIHAIFDRPAGYSITPC